MTFYLCENKTILVNFNYVESILIEECGYVYEARAYLPDGKYYSLESFDSMSEAKKFMEYIFTESREN